MDMKTLDISSAKAVAEQLRTEILDALAGGESLTSRELYDRCDSAEELAHMTNQLGQLQKSGKIEKAGTRAPDNKIRGSRSVPEYRLIDAVDAASTESDEFAPETPAAVADAIERAWDSLIPPAADTQWPDALEGQPQRGGLATGEDQDGDEFSAVALPYHPAYNPNSVAFRPARHGDPIIHLIERMDDYPDPKLQEGAMHEARIAALVARLERGLPIYPDPDLNAYLADVRDLFGALSA